MAVGEYVSMRAQVELLERLLMEEAAHLRHNPAGARAELEELIKRVGLSRQTARQAARRVTDSTLGLRLCWSRARTVASSGRRPTTRRRGRRSMEVGAPPSRYVSMTTGWT